MPRDIGVVIASMINEIPKDQEGLIKGLERVKRSAWSTAPELMYVRWGQASDVLQDNVPVPEEDWEVKVCPIFSTLPEESIREYAKKVKGLG